MTVDIRVEQDAPPVVLGTAARLRRSATDPSRARTLRRMKGVLAMRSPVDPQSVTIRFDRGDVRLSRGVATDADVVITIDFNSSESKPKVSGAARHPLLALGAAKVLEPPTGTWQEEAEAFWEFARDWPRMPRSMRIVCIDEGTEIHLGEVSEPEYEVHGARKALSSAFSGSTILIEDALNGRLQVVGSLEHGSIIAGRAIAWALGQGR